MAMLREFLYVDTSRVRSMLAQLDGSVAEEIRLAQRDEKKTEGGFKGYMARSSTLGSEEHVSKSLGDTLFPTLEVAIESEGILTDISEELRDVERWTTGYFSETYPPGSLVRITAPGALFDARYVANILSGFSSTAYGLQGLGILPDEVPPSATNPNRKGQRQRRPDDPKYTITSRIEADLPDFAPIDADEGDFKLSAKYLRAIINLAAGLFTPGLHLNLVPTEDDRHVIGVRLQEGRQYLDGEPEILFARYGSFPQEWTAVGTIGHHPPTSTPVDTSVANIVDENGTVSRLGAASQINSLMRYVGQIGFADLPQYFGFTLVPLAAYRLVSPGRTMDGPPAANQPLLAEP